jgi:hypothetical protein
MKKTLHQKLSESRRPINKQAALALHKPKPEFESELDKFSGRIESDTFIQPYGFEHLVNLYHPNERNTRKLKDYSGSKYGQVRVLGVYLPDYDDSIPWSRRWESYNPQPKRCPTCGGRNFKDTQKATKRIPQTRWVCRCHCGNFIVVNNDEIKRESLKLSCSECKKTKLLQEEAAEE